MLEIAIWFYVAVSACLIAWNIARRRDLEALPSAAWLLLMGLPYAIQLGTLPDAARGVQTLGVGAVGVCLWVADSINLKRLVARPIEQGAMRLFYDYRLYAAAFVVVIGFQLSQLERIPLVEKFVHHVDDAQALAVMREETSKLLPVSDLVKYVFTWASSILAPLTLVFMIYRRKFVLAAVFLVVAILCAAMSLAKAPVYLLLAYVAVVLLSVMSFRRRVIVYAIAALLALPIAWNGISFLIRHPESVFNYMPAREHVRALDLKPGDPRAVLTYGDRSRLRPLEASDGLTVFERSVNRYAYRVFLGPSDVSSRWYQYFPALSGGFIGFQGLRPQDRQHASTQHPARLVGTWAYRERFPDKYLDTVQAYGSVDADAYARFGAIGVVAVALLVVGLRLGLQWLSTESLLSRTLYMLAIVQLAALLPIASLQAILLPNGLIVIVGLMLASRYAERLARARGIARQARA